MMLSQMVNVTTSEIKKGRYDSKDLEGQVVWLDENHIMVFLNETIQRLDKNQHFHPDEGSSSAWMAESFAAHSCTSLEDLPISPLRQLI